MAEQKTYITEGFLTVESKEEFYDVYAAMENFSMDIFETIILAEIEYPEKPDEILKQMRTLNHEILSLINRYWETEREKTSLQMELAAMKKETGE